MEWTTADGIIDDTAQVDGVVRREEKAAMCSIDLARVAGQLFWLDPGAVPYYR